MSTTANTNSITLSQTKVILKSLLAIFTGMVLYIFIAQKAINTISVILVGLGVKSLSMLSVIVIIVFSIMLGFSIGTTSYYLIDNILLRFTKESMFIYKKVGNSGNRFTLYKEFKFKSIIPQKLQDKLKSKSESMNAEEKETMFSKFINEINKIKGFKVVNESEVELKNQ